MMNTTKRPLPFDIWPPLYRNDLEILLSNQEYTRLHLLLLYWLIWLPLLSSEELMLLLSNQEVARLILKNEGELADQLHHMSQLQLLDSILIREPALQRQNRYYVTDLGLYLYLSVVHTVPPLTIARLAKAYPVTRDDLLARLARPHIHLALSTLATRLIAEGTPLGFQLTSYQQPWQHTYTLQRRRRRLYHDSALLIQHPSGTQHAFFVHVDVGPEHRGEGEEEKFLTQLLDLRQHELLHQQGWPGLLLLTTRERLEIWTRLVQESSFKRSTHPLAGGVTLIDQLQKGVYTPIWWNFAHLPLQAPTDHARTTLPSLLETPAPAELIEHFSRQLHFHHLLVIEQAKPPLYIKKRLARYVGASLQEEAKHLDQTLIEGLLFGTKRDRFALAGSGLLTLALTSQQKEIIFWLARHQLLDLLTLLALMRPGAKKETLKLLQKHITSLFKLHLIETVQWARGKTAYAQQRYLLSTPALRFTAIRYDRPFTYYFATTRSQAKNTALGHQWATAGLFSQMEHTDALYTCIRHLLNASLARGEQILDWRSAHEATREYRDVFQQGRGKARPDAELVVVPALGAKAITLLLEYDRGTTRGKYHYQRKFSAYLDYQIERGVPLPSILVVTQTQKIARRIRRVLDKMNGLSVIVVLEKDLLAQGFAATLANNRL